MSKKTISAITGGGGDFGRAVAVKLGLEGSILLGDFREQELMEVAKELELLGIDVHTMPMDVREVDSCRGFAEKAASLGEVKNVINIAGVAPQISYIDQTISSPEHIFTSNSIGVVYMTDAFLPVMASGGSCVHFASQAGYFASLNENVFQVFDSCYEEGFLSRLVQLVPEGEEYMRSGIAYMLSKAFVHRYVHRNVTRFGKKGLRINTVSPGMHWTAQVRAMDVTQREAMRDGQPIKRYGSPLEMAHIVAFLCSDAAAYTTGSDILADGGGCRIRYAPQLD